MTNTLPRDSKGRPMFPLYSAAGVFLGYGTAKAQREHAARLAAKAVTA